MDRPRSLNHITRGLARAPFSAENGRANTAPFGDFEWQSSSREDVIAEIAKALYSSPIGG